MMANEKRLIEIPADGIVRIPIMDGDSTVGERAIDLSHMPTVDAVEVVHGRWEVIEASDELYRCSVCCEWQYIPEEHFAYCPYCGAKMDGEKEDG